jgi:acyl-CoA thioesterase-1
VPAGRYLALGDSFTIGTGGAPAQSFAARLVGRWTSGGCTLTLETVAIGANDIVRGHSIDAYRENVRRILDAAKGTGARVVVLPQPDWSRSPSAASFGTQAALATSIADFNAALAAEARAKGVEWVDLVPLMQEQAAKGQLASDGLHPSTEAYDAWAAEMARVFSSPCAK